MLFHVFEALLHFDYGVAQACGFDKVHVFGCAQHFAAGVVDVALEFVVAHVGYYGVGGHVSAAGAVFLEFLYTISIFLQLLTNMNMR